MFSFSAHKKVVDVFPYLRRICDLTTPNLPGRGAEDRSENRYNRTIPTLLCPWENEAPVAAESVIVLTKDLTDRGVGLVLNQPVRAGDVVVGFWLPGVDMTGPWYLLGKTLRSIPFGGGFWTVGVELTEYANQDYSEQLEVLKTVASKLLPQADTIVA